MFSNFLEEGCENAPPYKLNIQIFYETRILTVMASWDSKLYLDNHQNLAYPYLNERFIN
jgi:hypothetical protein